MKSTSFHTGISAMKYLSIWNNKGDTEQGKDCLIRSSGYKESGGSVGGRQELSPVEGCTC